MNRAFFSLALTLACAARAQVSPTQLPGFQLERLELDPSAEGALVVGTGRLLPAGAYRAAVAFHYEKNPMLARLDGQLVGAVVSDRLTAHLVGAYGVMEALELSVRLPLVITQTGDDLSSIGVASPDRGGLSTPTLGARYQLLRSSSTGFDLAAGLDLGLPVGSLTALAQDPGLGLSPRLSAGSDVGPLRLSADAAFHLRPTVAVGQTEVGSRVELAMAGATTVAGKTRGELTFRSALPLTSAPASFELLGGARHPIGPFELFVLGGPGLGKAPGTPQFRVLLGLGYQESATASAPASLPEPPPAPAVPPDTDSDQDGVKDAEDKCRTQPGLAAFQGCPPSDKDQDGVLDPDDACPEEVGLTERKGCPVRDADGDGIEDSFDLCPQEPGLAELRGCIPKDTDQDGVVDEVDNCPNEKGFAENQGCPKKKKQLVVITKEKLVMKEKVFFQTAKATIQRRSFPLLDQIAAVIQEHPEIPAIDIEGHTDDRGSADFNRRLSQGRAESVRAYLVKKGVLADRLRAIGYGPDRPAATNDTAAGREANRRVELTIVGREQTSIEVEDASDRSAAQPKNAEDKP
ncbi:MAG: OmpA family protein [Myxococcota bacterium]